MTITLVFSGIPLQDMITISFAGAFDTDDLIRDHAPSRLLSWLRVYISVEILLLDSQHTEMILTIRTSSLNNAWMISEIPMTYDIHCCH
jgi:hypothetical protein